MGKNWTIEPLGSLAVEFVRGKEYRPPGDGDERWCANALREIAATRLHPIPVRLTMSDKNVISGNLESVDEDGLVTLEVSPRRGTTVYGDEIESFYMEPGTSDEIRG